MVAEVIVRIEPHKNMENKENSFKNDIVPIVEFRVQDSFRSPKGNRSLNESNEGWIDGMKKNMKVVKITKKETL